MFVWLDAMRVAVLRPWWSSHTNAVIVMIVDITIYLRLGVND